MRITRVGLAAASAGDGRVLVVNRSEGATFSVRGTLVTP